MYEKHFPITNWHDFVTAELDEGRPLTACGLSVILDNEELAVALSHLSKQDVRKSSCIVSCTRHTQHRFTELRRIHPLPLQSKQADQSDVEDYVIPTLIDSLLHFRLELMDKPKTE